MLRIARHQDLIVMHGALSQNRTHRHHAMQAVWAAPNAAQLSCNDTPCLDGSHLIESGTPHALTLTDGVVCLIEGESRRAAQLRAAWLTPPAPSRRVPTGGTVPTLLSAPTWLETLAASTPEPPALDSRMTQLLHELAAAEAEGRWLDVTLPLALAQTHLSQSRFLHLFSEQMGTPWRTYIVWRRALVAVTLASQGNDLTTAAQQAGYADSAHLSRQFKALFGLTPSHALKISQFVQF